MSFFRPDPLSVGYRAVTNRAARSHLSLYTPAKVSERDENSNAYRAVARRRSAYAAMTTRTKAIISFLAFRRRQLDRRRRKDGARRVLKDQALGLPVLDQIGKVVEGFQLSLHLKPVDQENTYLLFFSTGQVGIGVL